MSPLLRGFRGVSSAAPVTIVLGALAFLAFLAPVTLATADDAAPDESPYEPLYTPELSQIRERLILGSFAEAESLARAQVAYYEGLEDPLRLGLALDGLVEALVRSQAGDPETEQVALRAVEVRERAGVHPRYRMQPLRGLAFLYLNRSDYQRALPLAEKVLQLAREWFPPGSRDVVLALNLISVLYDGMGEPRRARESMEECIAILEASSDPNPLELAQLHHNLAQLLTTMGDIEEAEARVRTTLSYWERTNTDHPEFARTLANLSQLEHRTGNYVAERELAERALALDEKLLGPDHPDIAWDLQYVANALRDLGNLEAAEEYYRRAIAIRERHLGPNSPVLGFDLANYGWMKYKAGRYEEAIELLERSVAIADASQVGTHRASLLHRLAGCERKLGRLDASEAHLSEAIEVWRSNQSPYLASGLESRGYLSLTRGDATSAQESFAQALEIIEVQFAANPPMLAGVLAGSSRAALALRDYETAFDTALRAESIARSYAREAARHLEENSALDLSARRGGGLDVALSIAAAAPGVDLTRLYDAVVRSRSLALEEMAERRAALALADPETRDIAIRLTRARTRLANLLVSSRQEGAQEHSQLLQSARGAKEQAERALVARSQRYRAGRDRLDVGYREVQTELSPGSALVSIVQYVHVDDEDNQRAAYAALVLAGDRASPVMVELGPARTIDDLVAAWRQEVGMGERDPTRSPGASVTAYRKTGEALRRVVWDPIARHLEDIQTVFVVLDGSLHFLNLSTLPVAGDRYLLELEQRIHVLSSERDLVASPSPVTTTGLLALGDVDYGERSALGVAATQSTATGGERWRGQAVRCEGFDDLRFDALPASGIEVEGVVDLWQMDRDSLGQASRATGAAATETQFKAEARGNRVLHLATHGFFLGEGCATLDEDEYSRLLGENPLVLSGLALAGANRRDTAAPSRDDGILTAEEIVSLDLTGTEWAVLSACNTGLGTIAAGEGVLGLRRAFLIAGARSVIMSLWPVSDRPTQEWMLRLYRHRFAENLSTAEAVRQASLDVLRQRRDDGLTTHPVYWGAFVSIGDWR